MNFGHNVEICFQTTFFRREIRSFENRSSICCKLCWFHQTNECIPCQFMQYHGYNQLLLLIAGYLVDKLSRDPILLFVFSSAFKIMLTLGWIFFHCVFTFFVVFRYLNNFGQFFEGLVEIRIGIFIPLLIYILVILHTSNSVTWQVVHFSSDWK